MKRDYLEKVVPFGLLGFFGLLIAIRISNIFHISIANTDQLNAHQVIAISGLGALAAIFAIVISISLMAVQFASLEYTYRILGSYMKSPGLWSLIAIYIGTMIYNLYVVGFLEEHANTTIVDVSTLLQVLCFLMLIPHFVSTTTRLNPNNIIDRILQTVNGDYLASLEKYYHGQTISVPSDVDRVLPVVEIVEKAITKGDRDTTRTTLEKLYGCYNKYTRKGAPIHVRRYFIDYLLRIGQQGVISGDDDIVVRVINMFGQIGESDAAEEATDYSQILIMGALKKDYDASVQEGINSLVLMLKASPGSQQANKIFSVFGELVSELFRMGKLRLVSYLLKEICNAAAIIVNTGDQAVIGKSVEMLERIGLTAAQQGLAEIIHLDALAFHKIGMDSLSRSIISEESILRPLFKIEQAIPPEYRQIKAEVAYIIGDLQKIVSRPAAEKSEGKLPFDTSELWGKNQD